MKVLLLADPGSAHTIKWAKSLSTRGITICIFGLSDCDKQIYKDYCNINVKSIGFKKSLFSMQDGAISKSVYLKALPALKRIIDDFEPDILHAHYATSYGLLGSLTGFHPFIISMWGADIYDFPNKSFLHKLILKRNLKKCDYLFSTSKTMAEEAKKYTAKEINVVAFGIDLDTFKPVKSRFFFKEDEFVVGTIKSLEDKYGIETLIKAFKMVVEKYSELPLKLFIVGGGGLFLKLNTLVEELGLSNKTIFTGYISPEIISRYQNELDIYVSLSVSNESFGVAALEASACEKPVVVSNIGGLTEVVEDGKTGIVVPPNNIYAAAGAIEKLIKNPELRRNLGRNGRERVRKYYNWNDNVEEMINYYSRVLDN